MYGLVAQYIRDPRLRQAFTFEPLLVGGHPFRASSIYLLIHWLERKWGVHFALGGTTSIVRGLVELLEESGVDVRLNAPVEEIIVEHGRVVGVRTAAGERIDCTLVVSNGDPSFVYTEFARARSSPSPHESRGRAGAAVDESLRRLFRRAANLSRARASHDPAWPALSRPPRRRIHAPRAGRRLLALSPRAHAHRCVARATGVRNVLRAFACAEHAVGVDWERSAEPYFANSCSLERRLLPGPSQSS